MSFESSAADIFIIISIVIVILALIPWLFKKGKQTLSENVQQKETDMRLTYKRFMQLYPYSRITYAEYKQMQAKQAYKRAVDSLKIKRMVR
jgi:Tfp pilus assembly protein PilO